ncbi:atp synthase alpha chain precursor [Trichoderma arundinaceum]|uniref:Atp synthase alpha chain n=1 Tax=Trichoderma arundinaceum TaxID=490622 RepID=A0A395NJA7_TRIAR|nr:atp synthase alpha chain precursor [Trichoderma arundinaceum]
MGGAESKEAHSKIHKATLAGVTFPNTMELYYDPSWKKLKLSLGESPSEPLYMFNLPEGWWGDLIMYNGPTLEHPPLAAVRNTGKTAMGNVVTLPPLGSGQEVIEEKMSRRRNGMMDVFSFAAVVEVREGEKPTRRVERFEWVSSGSKEVKDLHEWSHGWKLRRVAANGADEDADKDADADDEKYEAANDSTPGEILAVWADATKSLKKAAKFQFINSGATGELGDAWALMAVITFVRVWQRYMQVVVV